MAKTTTVLNICNNSCAARIGRPCGSRSLKLMTDVFEQAIASLNDIAAAIEAHQRTGKYDAEALLDQINGQARER